MSTIETSNLEEIQIKALNDAAAALQAVANAVSKGEPVGEQVEALNKQLMALKQVLSVNTDVEAYVAIFRQIISQGGKYQVTETNKFEKFCLTRLVDSVDAMFKEEKKIVDHTLSTIVHNIKVARDRCQDLLDRDIAAFDDALQAVDVSMVASRLALENNGFETDTVWDLIEEGTMPVDKKLTYVINEEKPGIKDYPIFLQSYIGETINTQGMRPAVILARQAPNNNVFRALVLAANQEHDSNVTLSKSEAAKLSDVPWPAVTGQSQRLEDINDDILNLIDTSYRQEQSSVENTDHLSIRGLDKAKVQLMNTLGCLGQPDQENNCYHFAYEKHQENNSEQEYLPNIYAVTSRIPESFYSEPDLGQRLTSVAKIGGFLAIMKSINSQQEQYIAAIEKGDIQKFEALVDSCSDPDPSSGYSYFAAAKVAIRSKQLLILKRLIEKDGIEVQKSHETPIGQITIGGKQAPTLLFTAIGIRGNEQPDPKIISYLIEQGADIFARNHGGKSPLMLAFDKEDPRVILNAMLDGLEKHCETENNTNAKQHIELFRNKINNGLVNEKNVNAEFSSLMQGLRLTAKKENSFLRHFFQSSVQKNKYRERSQTTDAILVSNIAAKNAETPEIMGSTGSKKRKRGFSGDNASGKTKVAKRNVEEKLETPTEIKEKLIKLIDARVESLGDITPKSSIVKRNKVNELRRLRAILKGEDRYDIIHLIEENKKLDFITHKIMSADDKSLPPSKRDDHGRINLALARISTKENNDILSQPRNKNVDEAVRRVKKTFINFLNAVGSIMGKSLNPDNFVSESKDVIFLRNFKKLCAKLGQKIDQVQEQAANSNIITTGKVSVVNASSFYHTAENPKITSGNERGNGVTLRH